MDLSLAMSSATPTPPPGSEPFLFLRCLSQNHSERVHLLVSLFFLELSKTPKDTFKVLWGFVVAVVAVVVVFCYNVAFGSSFYLLHLTIWYCFL